MEKENEEKLKKLNKELESLKQKKKGKNNDSVIKTLELEI